MFVLSDLEGVLGNPTAAFSICLLGTMLLLVVAPVFIYYWYRVAAVRAETELKHAMIERGMSVEEIERVLQAKSSNK